MLWIFQLGMLKLHHYRLNVKRSGQVVVQNLKSQKFKTFEPRKQATRGHHMVTNLDLYHVYCILEHYKGCFILDTKTFHRPQIPSLNVKHILWPSCTENLFVRVGTSYFYEYTLPKKLVQLCRFATWNEIGKSLFTFPRQLTPPLQSGKVFI